MRARTKTSEGAAENPAVDGNFSDGYCRRDYEVILDLLYGLYTEKEAGTVRVFDPFAGDTRRAPMVTPLMLAERIESLIDKNADA